MVPRRHCLTDERSNTTPAKTMKSKTSETKFQKTAKPTHLDLWASYSSHYSIFFYFTLLFFDICFDFSVCYHFPFIRNTQNIARKQLFYGFFCVNWGHPFDYFSNSGVPWSQNLFVAGYCFLSLCSFRFPLSCCSLFQVILHFSNYVDVVGFLESWFCFCCCK